MMFDCAGCGLKNMDMELIQYMISVFKEYYPHNLNYILVFEMPWVLNGKSVFLSPPAINHFCNL